MWAAFDAHLLAFVRGTRCSFLDLVIDTRGVGISARPHLALWAFATDDLESLDAAMARAYEIRSLDDLFDAVAQVKSDDVGISVAWLFPTWPDDLDAGERALAEHITALATREELAGIHRIWLRFMDAPEWTVIR